MNLRLLIAALLAASSLNATSTCPARPERVIIGVDWSVSITPEQRTAWIPEVQKVIACLAPGARLEIFGIHTNTGDSAPLFAGDFPVQTGRTHTKLAAWAKARKSFLAGASTAVEKAFSPDAKAQSTDIFGLFDRIRPSPLPTSLFLFSDGYHSAPDLCLETTPVTPSNLGPTIRRVASHHRWSPGTLNGVAVNFVLPSVKCCGARKPVNGRRTIKLFYETLAPALGGRLGVFETHL